MIISIMCFWFWHNRSIFLSLYRYNASEINQNLSMITSESSDGQFLQKQQHAGKLDISKTIYFVPLQNLPFFYKIHDTNSLMLRKNMLRIRKFITENRELHIDCLLKRVLRNSIGIFLWNFCLRPRWKEKLVSRT